MRVEPEPRRRVDDRRHDTQLSDVGRHSGIKGPATSAFVSRAASCAAQELEKSSGNGSTFFLMLAEALSHGEKREVEQQPTASMRVIDVPLLEVSGIWFASRPKRSDAFDRGRRPGCRDRLVFPATQRWGRIGGTLGRFALTAQGASCCSRKHLRGIDLAVEGRGEIARAWSDPKGRGPRRRTGGRRAVADQKGRHRFVALAIWLPDKILAKTCADFSDLELGPDGRLYLLSDKSSTIARLDDLPPGGGAAALLEACRLGDLEGTPEGLAFTAQGRAVVGLDPRKPRRNLLLLELAVAELPGGRQSPGLIDSRSSLRLLIPLSEMSMLNWPRSVISRKPVRYRRSRCGLIMRHLSFLGRALRRSMRGPDLKDEGRLSHFESASREN